MERLLLHGASYKNEAGTIFQAASCAGAKFLEVPMAMADNTEKDPDEWVSGHDPMTGAQASYLKTLAEQAHEPSQLYEG
jgi:DUF3072 family protein